jgi:hypothetical protein
VLQLIQLAGSLARLVGLLSFYIIVLIVFI